MPAAVASDVGGVVSAASALVWQAAVVHPLNVEYVELEQRGRQAGGSTGAGSEDVAMLHDDDTHELLEHDVPVGQTLPHVPQFAGSVRVSTHAAPHIVRPAHGSHDGEVNAEQPLNSNAWAHSAVACAPAVSVQIGLIVRPQSDASLRRLAACASHPQAAQAVVSAAQPASSQAWPRMHVAAARSAALHAGNSSALRSQAEQSLGHPVQRLLHGSVTTGVPPSVRALPSPTVPPSPTPPARQASDASIAAARHSELPVPRHGKTPPVVTRNSQFAASSHHVSTSPVPGGHGVEPRRRSVGAGVDGHPLRSTSKQAMEGSRIAPV